MKTSLHNYRIEYLSRFVSPGYRGYLHLASVLILGTVMIVVIAWRYGAAIQPIEWLTVPLTVLIASLVEYSAHRGPMHHQTPGLGALFERHTRRHHRYFVARQMLISSEREFHVVLFPPVLIGFFASVAIGLGCLVALFTTPAVGALFAITSIAYYLAYELLHLSYHTNAIGNGFGRSWLKALARHHERHHDPHLMQQSNFNLVLPIFDWWFGTLNTSEVVPDPVEKPLSEFSKPSDGDD